MGPEAVARVAKLPTVLLFLIIITTQSMTAEAGGVSKAARHSLVH
jgi:hypothetical protein